jgi:hypothetical protein
MGQKTRRLSQSAMGVIDDLASGCSAIAILDEDPTMRYAPDSHCRIDVVLDVRDRGYASPR